MTNAVERSKEVRMRKFCGSLALVLSLTCIDDHAEGGWRCHSNEVDCCGNRSATFEAYAGLTHGRPWSEGPLVSKLASRHNRYNTCPQPVVRGHFLTTLPGIQTNR